MFLFGRKTQSINIPTDATVHDGGPCPFPFTQIIDKYWGDGRVTRGPAHEYKKYWTWRLRAAGDRIVAYRIVPKSEDVQRDTHGNPIATFKQQSSRRMGFDEPDDILNDGFGDDIS